MTFEGGRCELLQLWNEEDARNLVANWIGHALEKRRAREPLCLFFALVDDTRFLSVVHESGAVVVETVGGRGPQPVSPSLAEFLEACSVVTKAAN